MTPPFGGPVHIWPGEAEDGTSATTPQADMDLLGQTLAGLGAGEPGLLRLHRPRPTAAFSPRDRHSEGFAAAAQLLRDLGFEPVERRAGGRLAVYDRGALVIDLVSPHPEPRAQFIERFRLFAGAIASALASLAIDARIGALAGEYCPGDYSVNGAGRIKLAGLAQRIGRHGYHLGAVIGVAPSERAKAAVTAAYPLLGLEFEPATFGTVADLTPDPSFSAIRQALLASLAAQLDVRSPVASPPKA